MGEPKDSWWALGALTLMRTRRPHQLSELDSWLSAALTEYAGLREESLRALEAQQVILRFGVTALAVLIGFGLNLVGSDFYLTVGLLMWAVPAAYFFVAQVWIGELNRISRAAAGLAGIETRVNEALKKYPRASRLGPALRWESWLRDHPRVRLLLYYRMSFISLAAVSIVSVGIGVYFISAASWPICFIVLHASGGTAITCGGAVLYVVNERRALGLASGK